MKFVLTPQVLKQWDLRILIGVEIVVDAGDQQNGQVDVRRILEGIDDRSVLVSVVIAYREQSGSIEAGIHGQRSDQLIGSIAKTEADHFVGIYIFSTFQVVQSTHCVLNALNPACLRGCGVNLKMF